MHEPNITSLNIVTAAQFMLSLGEAAINNEFKEEAILWTFNVKHTLAYYLSLKNGKIIPLSLEEPFRKELNRTLLALSDYSRHLFQILNAQAKEELLQHLEASINCF